MTRPTYDEQRDRRRPCACGRHMVTGGDWLTCPWAVLVRGRWGVLYTSEVEAGHE